MRDGEKAKCYVVVESSNDTPFLQVFEEVWDADMRGRLLGFATGSTRLPLDGFSPPLTIVKREMNQRCLRRTRASTNLCFQRTSPLMSSKRSLLLLSKM